MLRELGNHPDDGGAVQIFEGKYGPYIKHAATNATVPKDTDIATVSLEQAVLWLAEKASKGGGKKGGRKTAAKKAAVKKSVAKKATRKPAKKSGETK